MFDGFVSIVHVVVLGLMTYVCSLPTRLGGLGHKANAVGLESNVLHCDEWEVMPSRLWGWLSPASQVRQQYVDRRLRSHDLCSRAVDDELSTRLESCHVYFPARARGAAKFVEVEGCISCSSNVWD